MGYFQVGTQYGARGGDPALARRYKQFEKMQALARHNGVLPEDQEAPDPEGFSGLFFRAVDLISRPNYAVAGFFDTLNGTGKPGEYAMERAFREMFSGVAGLEGDKETWGDVLEQGGMGEGGKLSDLVGENGLTKRFNPTTRGAVGVALDIFTDPLTYISAPVKNAAVVVGVGGEVRFLNKAGLAARTQGFQRQMEVWRRYLGVADDVAPDVLYKKIGESAMFAKRNSEAAQALAKSPFYGAMEVEAALYREVGERLVKRGADELFEKTGLRYRPLPGVDIPVGIDKAVAKVSGFLWDGMKRADFGSSVNKIRDEMIAGGTEFFKDLDKLFNHIPILARKNTAYYRSAQERFNKFTAAEHIARLEARSLMVGVPEALWKDRALWDDFAHSIEAGGQDLANWMGRAREAGVEDPEQFLRAWKGTWQRVGLTEVESGLLNSADLVAADGAYFHRIIEHLPTDDRKALQQLSRRRGGRAGVPERAAREQRRADSWGDFKKAMADRGIDEEDLIVNPVEVAAARLQAHYEDLVNLEFLKRTQSMFGFKQTAAFDDLMRGLEELGEDADKVFTPEQRTFLEGLRERSSSHNPIGYSDARRMELRRIRSETPEGQAVQEIEKALDDLNGLLGEQRAKVRKLRFADEYRRHKNALSRAEIFDTNQFDAQAIAEQKLLRAVKRDLVAERAYLNKLSRRPMATGAGGHIRELEAELAAQQEKLASFKQIKRDAPETEGLRAAQAEKKAVKAEIARLKKEITDLNRRDKKLRKGPVRETASNVGGRQAVERRFFESVTELDEALKRVDDLDEVIAARKADVGKARGEADELIAAQNENIRTMRDGIKQFREEFRTQVLRYEDGETVRSLTRQLDELEKQADALAARRSQLSAQREAAQAEIRQTQEVFERLDNELARAREQIPYSAAQMRVGKAELKARKKAFRESQPTNLKQLSQAEMQQFRRLPKSVRAAYLHDTLSQIDNIQHFENFLAKYGDELDAVGPELRKLADTIPHDLVDQYGQKFRRVRVKIGKPTKNTMDDDVRLLDAQETLRGLDSELAGARSGVQRMEDALEDARKKGLEGDALEQHVYDLDVAKAHLDDVKARKADQVQHVENLRTQRAKTPTAGGVEELYLPEGIATDLENFEGVFLQNPEVGRVLRTYDRFSNWFKLLVTRYFPSFHVRNGYSNVAASYVDIGLEAMNPWRAKQSFDILRGAEGTIKLGGMDVPYQMVLRELESMGIRVDRMMISEFTGKKTVFDPVDRVLAKGMEREGVTRKAAGVATGFYQAPAEIENLSRALHYISLRRKGFTPQDAAIQVNKFLFDYAALAPAERAVFRRLFPFWTWSRKNVERQIKNLYERPGRIATQTKIFAGDRGPDGDLLPEYLRGQMNVQVQQDDDGETWLTGIDLPISNLDVLWAGGFGKTFREQIGMLTPIIKTPLETGVGQDFFTGESLRGVGQIREKLGYAMNRNLPQVMKDYFELENVGTADDPRWQANRLKLHIVTKATFLSRFVSSNVQVMDMVRVFGEGDEAEGAARLLKVLSGLDLRSFDLEAEERAVLYNRSRRLEDLLVERGYMREFRKKFIPKERSEELEAATGGGGGGYFARTAGGAR